ncbi:MAG TPA: NBR1-Ig-like domain-containing protein, partial [Pyrinomonadaceae bacterium]|nr:NBR1-Ig-like domain-containing protein [Pyrinomonadaceae bacterium]
AFWYTLHYEWSMRPTAVSDFGAFKYEARFLLRDRRLRDFLSEDARARLADLRGWVESGVKSNGVEALVDPEVPIITASHPEYFATRTARASFVKTIEAGPARMLSLVQPEDLWQAKEYIKSRGLTVGRVMPLQVPFFSQRRSVGMMLVEVSLPEGEEGRATLERFWKAAAFPDTDYRAEIKVANPPAALRPGERLEIRFRVRNAGGSAWPARGDSKGAFQVNAGDRWLDSAGARVVNDLDGRTSLAEDLRPGEEVELSLTVTAPRAPGDYVLELDMVHEGVTFFRQKGSPTWRTHVRVE